MSYEKNKFLISSIEKKVIDSIAERAAVGYKKYGVNMDRTDLSTAQWLKHLQEELLDASIYIEKLKENSEEGLKFFTPRMLRPYSKESGSEAVKNFELFNQFKTSEETIGYGRIPLNQIDTFPYSPSKLQFEAVEFFRYFYNPDFSLNQKPDHVISSSVDHSSFNRISRLFIITRYFYKYGRFDDPVFLKRDLITNKFLVHPGHGRWLVYRLFSNSKYIKALFWDYKKPNFEVIQEFNYWEEVEKRYVGKDVSNHLFPFYNTLVPAIYVTRNIQQWHENMVKSAFDFAEFFLYCSINANFDIGQYGYRADKVIEPKRIINVTVKDTRDTNQTDKAFLALILGQYQDDEITIETSYSEETQRRSKEDLGE